MEESFIIQQTKVGRKKVNPIFAIILLIVFIVGGQAIGEGILVLLHSLKNSENVFLQNVYFSSAEFVYFTAGVGILFLWIRYVEKRPIHTIGFTKKAAFQKYTKGLLYGLILFIVITGAMLALGYLKLDLQKVDGTVLSSMFIWMIAFLIQGAGEEILFRGWLFQVISVRTRVWVGVVVSSLVFGLLHLLTPQFSLYTFIAIVCYGIFFSLLFLKEGNLWVNCGVHTIWNWAQTCILGFGVSGEKAIGGNTLFNPILKEGPEFITDGTLFLIITLLIGSGLILRSLSKNKKTYDFSSIK
ncbi:CPBP family intramembrane glutamic endopeptidase [Brevibacillus ginsengisoli]|uniref:CPBP family intramembrane glutamic endopeptidase n=1 Tax=Brevibacillus ginsengisoli TaxID=363854 RepID=UPI003CEFB4FA